MENSEDEIMDLRQKNSELVLEVQYWKMTAAQKEKEKLDLMKDNNELRLKLGRVRSGGAAQARKLDAGLQAASEEALSHLVQASGAVARTIELAKQYMRDRQELEAASPRWSSISGPPSSEKVHRVPPTLMGGQSIQPVVALSRTLLTSRSMRSPTQNNVTERAVPMHMLQDLYIPLTRINMAELQANLQSEPEGSPDNSADDLGLEDSNEQDLEESQETSNVDDFDASRRLDAVMEEVLEPEDEVETPPRFRAENPLEGPSWLLDVPNGRPAPGAKVSLEPDSTTPGEEQRSATNASNDDADRENEPLSMTIAFTPTVRRRKRTSNTSTHTHNKPTHTTHAPQRHTSLKNNSGRILKVVVAKMRLSDEDPGGAGDASRPDSCPSSPDVSPPKRPAVRDSSPRSPDVRDSSPTRQDVRDSSPTDVRDSSPSRSVRVASQKVRVVRGSSPIDAEDSSPSRSPVRDSSQKTRVVRDSSPSRPVRIASQKVRVVRDSSPIDAEDSSPSRSPVRDTSQKTRVVRGSSTSRPPVRHLSQKTRVERDSSSRRRVVRDSSPRQSARESTPPNRPMRFDAPSPNGMTDAGVIVSEDASDASCEFPDASHVTSRRRSRSRSDSRNRSDGDWGEAMEGRTRRARKQVQYKEKPLNRKMRR